MSNQVYCNENDKHAAHWLSCLPLKIDAVDNRSIKEVTSDDVIGFKQCHFFAGIGGWPLALEMAGWPEDATVWTGSCPCQPFSQAGKRKGTADERHLWPEFYRLISECRPQFIFGEQVASAIGHGWLDCVFAEMEAIGYTCGAVVLGAHSVGAPHIRQRLYWVAYSSGSRLEGRAKQSAWEELTTAERSGDENRRVLQLERPSSQWSDCYFIECRDGKSRPVKSGLRVLAHGVSGRVAQLRGLGNAIVPEVAAEFVRAFMAIMPGGSE